MSVRILTRVWDHAPYDGGTLLVLLALADWANDAGWSWPSIDTLAIKSRLSQRQTQRVLRQLEKDEVIELVRGGGRARQHKYRVRLETLSKCRPLVSDETVTSEPKTVTSVTRKPREKVTRVSPDPSVKDQHVSIDQPSESAGAPPTDKKQKPKPYPHKSQWPRHVSIYFSITNQAPLQQLWPLIEQRLGSAPDVAMLRECYLAWVGRGYNARAITWLDWYRDGIPEYGTKKQVAQPNGSDKPSYLRKGRNE